MKRKKFKILIIFLLVFSWFLASWPRIWEKPTFPPKIEEVKAITCGFGSDIGGDQCRGYLTSGTTWNVPSDWNSSNNSIEAIGAGGNGGLATGSTNSGAGGGGGEYRKVTDVSLIADSTVDINIPSGGAGSGASGAWVKNGAGGGGTIVVEAKNGGNASGATAGSGGTGGTGAAANFDGGNGGTGGSSNKASGGGGGGSAGPTGAGKNGGDGYGGTNRGGGGGGGSNGGSSSDGQTPTGSTGGTGGNGTSGSGGGAGGGSNQGGSDGTAGGGGGGGGNATGTNNDPGGNGGVEDLWGTGVGPSGGGGAGGSASGTQGSGDKDGGRGGTYGGGGGGCGMSGALQTGECDGTGVGSQGIIVITYTPSAAVVSVSVSDGVVTYDIMPANTSKSTLSGELNDMQIATNDGNVTENFNVKGQDASGGGCTWTLAGTNGNDQYVHQFCNDTDYDCSSPPTNYTALTTSYQTLDTGIAVDSTVDFQLRITTPTDSSCYGQQSVDVTIQAVQ